MKPITILLIIFLASGLVYKLGAQEQSTGIMRNFYRSLGNNLTEKEKFFMAISSYKLVGIPKVAYEGPKTKSSTDLKNGSFWGKKEAGSPVREKILVKDDSGLGALLIQVAGAAVGNPPY